MNQLTLHNLFNKRIEEIETIINMESNDDDDLKQEGLLGAYQALETDPQSNKRFMMNKAKWKMISSLRKGRSVDNGFYKRKNLKILHFSQSLCEDGIFAEVVSNNGNDPVDEQAIFHIDLQRFLEKLTPNERRFIKYKTMDGLRDTSIKRKLRVNVKTLREMRKNIRRQIESSFSA